MKLVTYLDSAEFRKEVLKGITDLSLIVGQTLGPGGRPILIEQENGVLATKDGVTVALAYAAHTPIQKIVAQAAVEASTRTVKACGDGTTTSLVLAAAITQAGQEWLQRNPTYSPQRLARELKDILKTQIEPMVTKLSKGIKNLPVDEARKAIYHVAMVSSNSDENIANSVVEATDYVGQDGFVVIEEGAGGTETSVQHKDGFPVNSGLADLGGAASTAFVNRKNYGDCVLSGAYVTLYDGEINDIETVTSLLQRVASEQDERGNVTRRPLVIFAHGFGDTVLRIFANNFRKGTLSVVPMVTPRSGQANGRQSFLYDMLAYVGGNVFDPTERHLTEASPATIGFCEEVKVTMSDAVFMTSPDEEAVASRIQELKDQMEGQSEFDCDKMRYRIGRLTGGVATIYAGGATALEAKERRDRIVDAVSSVRCSVDLGIVPGGGATLLHIARNLPQVGPSQIFVQALTRPFVQILLNAGITTTEDDALINFGSKVGEQPDGLFYVFDALKREQVEWYTSGIFDPAKVTLSALSNSLSVAQTLMTTGGAIARTLNDGEHQARAMQEAMLKAVNNGELE